MTLPDRYRDAHAFSFGDTPEMAESGAADVVARRQVATCGAYDLLARDPLTMPQPGAVEIVLGGSGKAVCAIRTTLTDVVRFDEIDEEFARAEACRDLGQWREIHEAYFRRLGCYAPQMKIVRQYFEVVEVFPADATGSAAREQVAHRGHCRCGSVVMRAHAEPNFSVYCHCDDCRRSTGAPVTASVAFPRDSIVWEADKTLERYRVGTATRLFCRQCGSPVAQDHESAADRTFFNTGFMDDPSAFPPAAHTFAPQQLAWLELADDLPRHDAALLIKTRTGQ